MADKAIGELPRATVVTTTDLFVLEQAGQAKSLTGQVLINDLAEALDGHGGITSITLNDDYTLTFTMADETTVTTTSVRGEKGAKGDTGTDGRAITSIEKIDTSGLVDTYKISFSDNTSVNFTVTNGSSIKSIAKTGTSGLTDTYTVTLTDNSTSTFTVTNGNGIASITLQSGTHAAGTTDTYKITFDNGEFTTFSVYNGMNGSGSVVSVNGQSPDVDGNVSLTGANIPVSASDDTTIPNAIAAKQTATNDLTAEATLAEGDYFPFYDVSAAGNRKTPWSNILSKIRTNILSMFASTPLAVNSGGTGATDAAAARANLGVELGNIVANNAGAHNAIYRGKSLGSMVTAAQWAAIGAGTFEDLYIGDYWTIGGVDWRIAAFDYYFGKGDTVCTVHHVTIVPDTVLYPYVMNSSNTTAGGYAGSKLRNEGLDSAKTTVSNAFGSAHILSIRQRLCNAVTNGKPSGASWYDSTTELMTEQNVFGGRCYGVGNDGSTIPAASALDFSQYPLFAFRSDLISIQNWFWLRDVVSSIAFAYVGVAGSASYEGASTNVGVRPAFNICA